jgi:hypothetical protein
MLVDGREDFQATVLLQEHAIDDLQAWQTQLVHTPPPSITSPSERKRCQSSSKLETLEQQDMTAARNATRQLPTLVRKQCSTGGGGRSGFVVAPGLCVDVQATSARFRCCVSLVGAGAEPYMRDDSSRAFDGEGRGDGLVPGARGFN